jgi:hypothetical protein
VVNSFSAEQSRSQTSVPSNASRRRVECRSLDAASPSSDRRCRKGALGYPTAGEQQIPGGIRSDFEHGSITWMRETGEVFVKQ